MDSKEEQVMNSKSLILLKRVTGKRKDIVGKTLGLHTRRGNTEHAE